MRFPNFHSTATITEGNNTLNFTYGPNQQRKKTELLQQGAVVKTTYFLPAYEEITQGNDTYKVHYVGSQAIYVQHNNNQGELFYTYTDHLGSLLTLTDNTGNTIFEQNGVYPECNRRNAWGNHRNPQTWTSAPFTGSGLPWLIRGFTGHEHLPEFALININGRTYDPLLGRMLSVDNFVQDATSTQGYNRYSYVRNNPLKYTDPSGENPLLVAIVIGAIVGGSANVIANKSNINSFGEGLAFFGAGAIAGGFGAAAGAPGGFGLSLSSSILIGGATGGALNIGTDLAFNNLNNQSNFGAFVGSFNRGFVSGASGAFAGNVAGETVQLVQNGGSFGSSFTSTLDKFSKELARKSLETNSFVKAASSGALNVSLNAGNIENIGDAGKFFGIAAVSSFAGSFIDSRLLTSNFPGFAKQGISGFGAGLVRGTGEAIFFNKDPLQSILGNSLRGGVIKAFQGAIIQDFYNFQFLLLQDKTIGSLIGF